MSNAHEPNGARGASTAREQLALRNRLNLWLEPHELRGIAWTPLLNASADAIARGWTGDELARMVLGDIGGKRPDSVGAVAMTTIRTLAQVDPPREATPQPQPISELQQERAAAVSASSHVNHAAHAKIVRAAMQKPKPIQPTLTPPDAEEPEPVDTGDAFSKVPF